MFIGYYSYTMATPSLSNRRPYHGSCRCGFIRYIAMVSLPPNVDKDADHRSTVRFYKCNCTLCMKAGMFHMRLPDAPNDFYLLSPLNPAEELVDYKCADKITSLYFCPKCGVRCHMFRGKGKQDEVDLEVKPGQIEKTKVWRPDEVGWEEEAETRHSYLSVNAHTLDQPDGLDLRQLTEKKWILYIDCLEFKGEGQYDYPYPGGIW